jgi:hypothetical protein
VGNVHVATVSRHLPPAVPDLLRAETEEALHGPWATRVRVDPALPATAVVADLPV